jgi:hypothetical protein
MSHKSDRARFKHREHQPNGWKFARHKMANYFHGHATIAASAGDLEERAKYLKAAEAAQTMSASLGPPVPIATKRTVPPASPEEP